MQTARTKVIACDESADGERGKNFLHSLLHRMDEDAVFVNAGFNELRGEIMAIASDERDILDVFLIQNLANIAQNSPFVAAPLGIQEFIDTITIDNVVGLNFPSDVRDLLVNYILVRQIRSLSRTNQNIGQGIIE